MPPILHCFRNSYSTTSNQSSPLPSLSLSLHPYPRTTTTTPSSDQITARGRKQKLYPVCPRSDVFRVFAVTPGAVLALRVLGLSLSPSLSWVVGARAWR
ncbi:hypothetical protein Pcinc_017249 [Petrolisthes cinctipes]|uniref:Uncharacterized protein n=1 Tax=Petrolisthes cinctipes TaxID=88211 RepID=A0AAE1KNY1_PETCI|nr:hypothetical protein Pcinc_017249 [Petrolisthes cinctipes]